MNTDINWLSFMGACLLFFVAGITRSAKVWKEQDYLIPLKLEPFYGELFLKCSSVCLIISFLLLGVKVLKGLQTSPIILAYITIFIGMTFWRGGFSSLIKCSIMMIILWTGRFFDFQGQEGLLKALPFLQKIFMLGLIWNFISSLTIEPFLKKDPQENFLRASLIFLIIASSSYLLAILIPTVKANFITTPFVSILYSLLQYGSPAGAYFSLIVTMTASLTWDIPLQVVILINLLSGSLASIVYPQAKKVVRKINQITYQKH